MGSIASIIENRDIKIDSAQPDIVVLITSSHHIKCLAVNDFGLPGSADPGSASSSPVGGGRTQLPEATRVEPKLTVRDLVRHRDPTPTHPSIHTHLLACPRPPE